MDRLPQKFHQYESSTSSRHHLKNDLIGDEQQQQQNINNDSTDNGTTADDKNNNHHYENNNHKKESPLMNNNKIDEKGKDLLLPKEDVAIVNNKDEPFISSAAEVVVHQEDKDDDKKETYYDNDKEKKVAQKGVNVVHDNDNIITTDEETGPRLGSSLIPRTCQQQYWGGPFYDRLNEVDNDFDEYARNNQPFEGIHEVFARESGVVRRIIWFLWWSILGVIFIYGSIPDIRAFQNNESTTNLQTSTSIKGLPYPITTICPVGTGIRCDCQLWQILACQYNNDNDEGLFFQSLLCTLPSPWSSNNNSTLASICATASSNSNTTTIDWTDDPCGGQTNAFLDGPTLYRRVEERAAVAASSDNDVGGHPFITMEELLLYGGYQYDSTNLFVFTKKSANRLPEFIFSENINYNYLDLLQAKVCTQIRIPNNIQQQTSTGIDNGLTIFTNETFQSISSVEYLGLDMFLDTSSDSSSEYVYTVPEHAMPIPAGQLSYVGLQLRSFSRKQGYGDEASKTCAASTSNTDDRDVCVNKASIKQMTQTCSNCLKPQYSNYYNLQDQQALEYNMSFGCDASCFLFSFEDSPSTSIDDCPFVCDTNTTTITMNQQVPQSTWYKQFFASSNNNFDDITNVFLGYTTFDIIKIVETPAKTFASLTGEMGGNFNLWFGPNFMTLLLLIEMLTIGVVVSKCRSGTSQRRFFSLPRRRRRQQQ